MKPKATLRKYRNQWYARKQYRETNGDMSGIKPIPLRTGNKTVAYERLAEVNKVLDQIMNGIEFKFPWMDKELSNTKVIRLTLEKGFDIFCNARKVDGLRAGTLERYKWSIKTLYTVIGRTFPINNIRTSDIDRYKAYWFGKHSTSTLNLNLGKINAFLNWCYRKGHIKTVPMIEKVIEGPKPVTYISDQHFQEIMDLKNIDSYYKRVFLFYRETGLRREEPFNATLEGNWLVVKPECAKTHRERQVELSHPLLIIFQEMVKDWNTEKRQNPRWANGTAKLKIQKPRSIQDRYSKQFKKACNQIGIDRHFHNLRDTYAVRTWAVTGDIYLVSKLIGHTSVIMTEKYANFNLRRLLGDFPTLAKPIENRLDQAKFGQKATHLKATLDQIAVHN